MSTLKMPKKAPRLKQDLPPCRLLHILVVILVMHFPTSYSWGRMAKGKYPAPSNDGITVAKEKKTLTN